jgi:hypothetical protein
VRDTDVERARRVEVSVVAGGGGVEMGWRWKWWEGRVAAAVMVEERGWSTTPAESRNYEHK